jgi:CheY-like chemotaxis protein
MSSKRILIVDDWPDIRALTASFLHRRGYEVLQAKNGKEAIQTAVKENPNMVFVDLRLPDMEGVEVGRALHKFPTTGHIPLVGWTIDPASKPAREALEGAGFVDCIEKPFSLVALETLIERFAPRA